jgi:TusA-related sulfurtransferase
MPGYKVLGIVDYTEVPNWERRPPKWDELVQEVLQLKPGQTLEIFFDDPKEAERARNAVRDQANLEAEAVVVRTRLIKKDDGKALVYLTRLNPVDESVSKE